MRTLIAGGGTGGHIYIGVALARELVRRDPGARLLFAGTRTGLESRIVPREGFDLAFIDSAGLKRVGPRALVRGLLLLPLSLAQSWRLVRRFRPDVAVGVGGFSSGPVILAAALGRVPTLVVEPNAYPGFTNRRLARIVDRAAVALDESLPYFRNRGVVTGIPVRREFRDLPARRFDGTLRLLVYGGSQGSRALNRAMSESLPELGRLSPPPAVIHQTGEREWAAVRDAYARAGFAADVRPFLPRIWEEFAASDLVLSRAGAGTVAELTVAGMPALLVPFPGAADDHQTANARALERAGAARVIPEIELGRGRIVEEVRRVLAHPEGLAGMAAAARSLARPRATEHLADLVVDLARKGA